MNGKQQVGNLFAKSYINLNCKRDSVRYACKFVCVRIKKDTAKVVVQLICNYEWQSILYGDCFFDVTKLHLRWINYCGNGFSCRFCLLLGLHNSSFLSDFSETAKKENKTFSFTLLFLKNYIKLHT